MKTRSDVVFEAFCEGDLDYSDESVIKFALGYQLFKKADTHVAFNIQHSDPSLVFKDPVRFSPDVDVWEEHEDEPTTLIGYEVKSRGKGQNKVPRSELNKAIGQALMLLKQPYDGDPVLNQVYIAVPSMKLDSDWEKTFLQTIDDLPIGLVLVTKEDIEEVIEAEKREFEKRGFPVPAPAGGLRNKGDSKHNPRKGISSLAKELQSDYSIDSP